MGKDDDTLAKLRACATEEPPPELRDAVLAMGAAAVPSLIAILEDETLAQEDAPALGWPPIHAAELLADLRAPEAIDPMLRMLAGADPDTVIHERISVRLAELGAAVLEPALARLGTGVDAALCSIVSRLGVKDERVYAKLCESFDGDQALGATRLADYGDPRALPILEAAIAKFAPEPGRRFGIAPLYELVKAHAALGGKLPGKLRTRVDELSQAWNVQQVDRAALAGGVSAPKIGRNDPCSCGSGKKYKKCCLGRAPA